MSEEIKAGYSNGRIELLSPVELGWRAVQKEVELVVDIDYLRSLTAVVGNPYYEEVLSVK